MGLFERYLTLWVGLGILAGVGLGQLAPGAFQAIAALELARVNLVVAVFIWVMIYPMMIQIDWHAVKGVALVFHARSCVSYAGFEAARYAALDHARRETLHQVFARAIIPYYGGGRSKEELAASHARALDDLPSALRIELLSPNSSSFDDYHSPRAARALGVAARVIPNTHLNLLACPIDRPGCANDPATNRSGQTLREANLLMLRLTFGIPRTKQIPLAGRFFTWALGMMYPDHPDTFRHKLIAQGRIPVVSEVMLRMQSDAIETGSAAAGPDSQPATMDGTTAQALPDCSRLDPLCIPASGSEAEPDGTAGPGIEDADPQGGLQCS